MWSAQSQLSQECIQTHLKRREHGDRGPSPQRQSLHRRNAARGHGVCPYQAVKLLEVKKTDSNVIGVQTPALEKTSDSKFQVQTP
jgi:hypothetical protein